MKLVGVRLGYSHEHSKCSLMAYVSLMRYEYTNPSGYVSLPINAGKTIPLCPLLTGNFTFMLFKEAETNYTVHVKRSTDDDCADYDYTC